MSNVNPFLPDDPPPDYLEHLVRDICLSVLAVLALAAQKGSPEALYVLMRIGAPLADMLHIQPSAFRAAMSRFRQLPLKMWEDKDGLANW